MWRFDKVHKQFWHLVSLHAILCYNKTKMKLSPDPNDDDDSAEIGMMQLLRVMMADVVMMVTMIKSDLS